ncbi:hypothetical protein [Chryseobacterium sp. EO14]|uniref:hypothetical protein n=1 Tax=Chryseobacterium sp. EO14 TaxID=2950551 RepID=UPI002108EA44|nr:hypothetical protein [Chryseobacterium sp. EO14]MCQ4139237.1 hypothetical protein [Chryseobacterium sp. EO14]
MDNLEKFRPENFTEDTVKEINAMSYEDLKKLEDIPGLFLIRDKASNKPYTGQSDYRNLATLHRLGFANKYEVVGVRKGSQKTDVELSNEDQADDIDFISPEKSIILTGDDSPEEDLEDKTNKEREYQLKEYELLYGEQADESLSTAELRSLNKTKEAELLQGNSEEKTDAELSNEDQADAEKKFQEPAKRGRKTTK